MISDRAVSVGSCTVYAYANKATTTTSGAPVVTTPVPAATTKNLNAGPVIGVHGIYGDQTLRNNIGGNFNNIQWDLSGPTGIYSALAEVHSPLTMARADPMYWLAKIGMIPVRLTRPTVGLIPTRPLIDDGLVTARRHCDAHQRDGSSTWWTAITSPAIAPPPLLSPAIPTSPCRQDCTVSLPVGLSFFGTAWTEPTLLQLAYSWEQQTKARLRATFALSVSS